MDTTGALAPLPEPPGRRIAIALTVVVHLLLAALLVYGINWQKHAPDAISVELVRTLPDPVAAEPPPTTEPVKKVEPEPKPPPPVAKPDIAIKEKEKPKPPPKAVPPAPLKAAVPKVDPFAEDLRREEERLRQKREADTLAADLDKLKATQAAAARKSATDSYIGKIQGKIRGNIFLPSGIPGNPEAVFDVTQLPSGEVLSVKLRKSSGHAGWDAATERAILKSSPLPKPDRGDLFQRDLRLTFRPLDN